MSFLKNLFKKPISIKDEFFGNMVFIEVKEKHGNSYFECRRDFSPSQQEIEIGIDGDINVVTQYQKVFFKEIESNYSEISQSIIPLIENQLRNWKPDFEIKNFQNEFHPCHLILPNCKQQPVIWQITFTSKHDENHVFEASITDYTATKMFIDG